MGYGGRKKARVSRHEEEAQQKAQRMAGPILEPLHSNPLKAKPRTAQGRVPVPKETPRPQVPYISDEEALRPASTTTSGVPRANPQLEPIKPVYALETPQERSEALRRERNEAKGLIEVAGRWVVPPAGSKAFQRYQDIKNGLELDAGKVNPSSLSASLLPRDIQARVEAIVGPLPRIRVASGPDADAQARSINAVAFTSGVTIAFQSGHFHPETLEGFKLLVHEATHVRQQSTGQVSGSGIDPDMALEAEAHRVADGVTQIPELTHLEGKGVTRDQHIGHYTRQLKDYHGELGRDTDRFEHMREYFWQVPAEYQARTRHGVLTGFNPQSFEHQQLGEHLLTFGAGGLELKGQLDAKRDNEQAIKTTRAALTFEAPLPAMQGRAFQDFKLPERSRLPESAFQNVVAQYQEHSHSPQWRALNQAVWGETSGIGSSAAITPLNPHPISFDGFSSAQNKNTFSSPDVTATPTTPGSIPARNTPMARAQVQRATDFSVTPTSIQRSSGIVQRFSVMEEVSNFVGGVIPGYKTLCSVFGKDFITGKAVQQNPNAIMDALSDLVPGPIKDMVKALKESNALPKAWAWFKTELSKINIGAAFTNVKKALGDIGLFNIGETKDKVVKAIMTPVNQVKSLVGGSLRKLAEIALEAIGAAAGGSSKQLIDGLKGAGDVIMEVIKNPGKFVKNLISALTGGVKAFAGNAKTHLTQGLGQWLSGESGIQFPTNFDLKGVFTVALTVLGVTYQNFRKSLVKKLGEDKTKIAEDKVDLVKNLASKGMHAAEGMQGEQATVKTEVVEGAKDFVKTSVIQAAVTKLISMFIPGGGIIQLFMTAFDMVKFVVNEGSRIASLVQSIIGGVANIARGDVGGAISKVEQSLAKAVPLALSFMSRIFRVSGIGTKIKAIIQKVKGKIDAVVKRLMDKVAGMVAKIAAKLKGGKDKANPTKPGEKPSETAPASNTKLSQEEHDARVKAGLALIPTLESRKLSRGGVVNQAAAKWVATQVMAKYGVGQAQGVFKSVTPVFSGKKLSYNWVASSGTQNSTRGMAFIKFNLGQVRYDLWPGSGRPGWRTSTKRDLRDQYPDQHKQDSSGKATTSVDGTGNDRRHIEAFDHIVTTTVSKINDLPYDDAATELKGLGAKIKAKPEDVTDKVLKDGLKDHLTTEFNRVENLFVGDGAKNQQLGRDMESAEQNRDKAKAAGDAAKVEQYTRLFAENAVDVPPGKAGGNELTTRETGLIRQVQAADGNVYPGLTPNIVKQIKQKSITTVPDSYRLAQGDFRTLRNAIRSLAQFSKTGSPTANTAIEKAIKDAVAQQRRIADLLNGG
jgi:Domain of unknown function (DUF4157)